MNFQDKTLTCRDCGQEFVFTASEQAFYAEKQFANEPSRCPECRAKKKRERGFGGGGFRNDRDRGPRQMFPAVCAECGKETEVPFQPTGEKPVYCRDCFNKRREQPQSDYTA